MALIFKTAVSVISLAMMGLLVAVGIKSDESGKTGFKLFNSYLWTLYLGNVGVKV